MKSLALLFVMSVATVAHTAPKSPTPQSFVFVIDRAPAQLAQTKRLVVEGLKGMRADDTVSIIMVSGEVVPALREAVAILDDDKRRKHIVMLTDGLPSPSALDQVEKDFDAGNIIVDVIGFAGAGRNALALLSDKHGVRMFLVEEDLRLPEQLRAVAE